MNLGEPFIGEHEFRQTQTALSVWEMRAHGISLLHPRLPLFGPPWECPFEYPVFQLAAAAMDSIAPWKNLDASIRLTNLAFFYLTAVALYLLARLLFRKAAVSLFATAIFFFSTYNIFWSRTSMIESAATFFALANLPESTFVDMIDVIGCGLPSQGVIRNIIRRINMFPALLKWLGFVLKLAEKLNLSRVKLLVAWWSKGSMRRGPAWCTPGGMIRADASKEAGTEFPPRCSPEAGCNRWMMR